VAGKLDLRLKYDVEPFEMEVNSVSISL